MLSQRFPLLFFAVLLLSAGCNKDRWIRNDDAADELANALSMSTGGVAADLSQKTTYLNNNFSNLICNTPVEVMRQFQLNTGFRSAAYSYNWVVTKNCDGTEDVIEWTSQFSGTYEAPRLEGSTSGTRTWTATGVSPENENWVLNGNSTRSGSHQSRERRRRGFDTEVSTTFTDITVRKSTRTIIGGTVTASITLTGRGGEVRNFNAEVTFDSGGLMYIFIDGEEFILDLYA